MKVYTIEELHNLIVNQEIDLNKYYEELFDEVDFQQKRLNAFVPYTHAHRFLSASRSVYRRKAHSA